MSSIAQAETHEHKPPKIVVLGTGGTFAGVCKDPALGGSFYTAGVRGIDDLVASIPELANIADINTEQVSNIPSHSVTTEMWISLATHINELLADEDTDGIVITHGTDTMEETAYFLNLTIKSEKPVVLVGAMRPSNALSADGPLHLVNGVIVAASRDAWGKGVLVVMNGKINAARDVTKTNTLAVETFNSRELGYLGYVVEGRARFYRMSTRLHTIHSEFHAEDVDSYKRVAILYGCAEQDLDLAETAVRVCDGIIQAGTGNGSMSPRIQSLLEYAVSEKHIPVVRASRVGSGIITQKPNFVQSNFIRGDNLSPQKARVLLLLALSRTRDIQEIQRMFETY